MNTTALSIADYELTEVERANATARPPVIFIHGLWLSPSSWSRWVEVFETS